MTQTTFTVANAGSLTAALADISNGGTDAAVNTAYTITLTQLIDLPSPPTPSGTLALLSGSSLVLNGPGALQIASFLINGGTVSADVGISGSATLDNAVLVNAASFTGNIVSATGDTSDIVVNSGIVSNPGTVAAVQLGSGTVQSGLNGATTAQIDGIYAGVQFTSSGVVQTDGSIIASGTAGYGVFIGGSGMVTNGEAGATTALISAGGYGVVIEGPGTVSNAATISGGGGAGVYLASGLITNGGLVDTTALIGGGGEGVWIRSGPGTVGNFGTVRAGSLAGVLLGAGGTVVNGAPTDTAALIAGYQQGVLLTAAGSVTNYATIRATESAADGEGVFLVAGGTVSSLGTAAVITGVGRGVVVEGASGLVSNQGTIEALGASGLGVDLSAGGSVVNGSATDTSALIAGSYDGIRILTGVNDVVRNFGTITGSVGVDFNNPTASAAGTLVNAGLIEGTGGFAVEFGSGSETLVLEPGGRFAGGVLGGATGTTTLELAAGTKGTLSALGGDAGTVTDGAGSFAFQRIGTITVDSGASWAVTAPSTFDALDLAGTLGVQAGSVAVGGTLTNTGTIEVGANQFTADSSVAGNGTIDLATGGSVTFDAAVSTGQVVEFTYAGSQQDVALAAPLSMHGTIVNFGLGATIDLLNTPVTGFNFNAGVLTVLDNTSTVAVLNVPGPFQQNSFLHNSDNGTGTFITTNVPCFTAGTRIRTCAGEVAVERLSVGDRLPTLLRGENERVIWIGCRRVDCARHPQPEKVWPVRVSAHAFGLGMPQRDLLLSPDHAVLVRDVLVPVRYLVNGVTIVQTPRPDITYYHVELAQHDVIWAEGLPAESYLDSGDRSNFSNSGEVVTLHPNFADLWEAYGCLPLVVGGRALAEARVYVAQQAAAVNPAWRDLMRHAGEARR
jgi:Hint domain